ncbi:MAG: hypothetical protein OMM_00398 [Candidatus Magnetoglobus multicellularis str. Araruama]|uniref:DUF985 domain-containing protein n=1 Tax=Candidatus Magnetoglobus multicellularis str. Araruama TaxID=890399 RepID=A0A1V1PHF7_9BACT|nr:MAG: hypothetical protein OMM_00398 [Candidatus Magnetoglobus multicellularis str. Araruama]
MMDINKHAAQLIQRLDLVKHPEGGYYREVYRSESVFVSPKNGQKRHAMTDIFFLLLAGQKSRFHRIIHDEIWHFYKGDPLTLIDIQADNLEMSRITLGNTNSQLTFKHWIRGYNWQSAYTNGEYSLVGCTVAPGFEFDDFSFLHDNPEASRRIINKYPELKEFL